MLCAIQSIVSEGRRPWDTLETLEAVVGLIS